jgi:hypothetical protein
MKSQYKELHESIVNFIESKGFEFMNSDGETQTYFLPNSNLPVYLEIEEDCYLTLDREGYDTTHISSDHIQKLHDNLNFITK